jgi:hypothetical protein
VEKRRRTGTIIVGKPWKNCGHLGARDKGFAGSSDAHRVFPHASTVLPQVFHLIYTLAWNFFKQIFGLDRGQLLAYGSPVQALYLVVGCVFLIALIISCG